MKKQFTTGLVTFALCISAASGADVQPTNDLPNPYQTTAPCSCSRSHRH